MPTVNLPVEEYGDEGAVCRSFEEGGAASVLLPFQDQPLHADDRGPRGVSERVDETGSVGCAPDRRVKAQRCRLRRPTPYFYKVSQKGSFSFAVEEACLFMFLGCQGEVEDMLGPACVFLRSGGTTVM